MEVGWPKHSSVGFRCHWRQMERSWQMMWSNVKVQYLSPVLLVPPNVSGIALELADDEEEEEEGIMASMSQKIGQVCWDVVHERLCRVLERAVKQSTRRASMNATVLDGSKWDLKPKSLPNVPKRGTLDFKTQKKMCGFNTSIFPLNKTFLLINWTHFFWNTFFFFGTQEK